MISKLMESIQSKIKYFWIDMRTIMNFNRIPELLISAQESPKINLNIIVTIPDADNAEDSDDRGMCGG